LPTAREGAVNKQDALAATRTSDVCVGVIRHGTAAPADEGDHELVGSQHVSHVLSRLVRCASLRPDLPASTKKSAPELT
jgi:hypothetical protein